MARKSVVLIVDNHTFLIDLLIEHLSKEELQTFGATSGEEAKSLFDLHRPDLAIVNPSVLGGFDLLQHIRSTDTPCAVIALTDSEEAHRSMEALGIEIVLNRKANLKALLVAMQTYVKGVLGLDSDETVRILVVDDETDLLQLLQRFLSGRGYSVVTAKDGLEALEALTEYPDISIVLLDIKMPNMGGIEVLKEIMAGKPHPEVIMMTALSDAQIAKLAFKLGAFDYCLKPFDLQRLEGLIIACLGHAAYGKQSA